MKIKEIFKTSVAIYLLKFLCAYYLRLDKKMENIYHESYVGRIVTYFRKKLRLSFGFSSFRIFVEVIEKGSPAALCNSRFGRWITDLYKKLQNAITGYTRTSLSEQWTKSIKKEFNLYSFKAVSIILILAIIVNFMLLVALGGGLGVSRLVILALFLVIAVAGLLCNVDWPTLKRGSIILKILFR